MAKKLPGEGGIAARPLHFFWLIDCSGSMAVGGKIQQLNNAIEQALPDVRKEADDNPFAEMFVRAITFSNGAQWHVSQPTPVNDFKWTAIEANDGVTDMGAAFTLLSSELSKERLGERGYPPVIVLLSDGQPTDDYKSGLKQLMNQPWGKRAARIAIAIGSDADKGPLQEFIGHAELKVLEANNPERLAKLIKWASATASSSVAKPASQAPGAEASENNVPLAPPPPVTADDGADVW